MDAHTKKLHYETVNPLLQQILETLMSAELFTPFRLVGGTNLSLRYGHRISIDIDLFTEAVYGSLDFHAFEKFLKEHFAYYECSDKTSIVGFGRGYYIGNSSDEYVKLDLMYTDPFLEDSELIDGIRLATVKDIIAMKMNVISHGGRKKDFWDIHLLLKEFSLSEMFAFHAKRYEWEHNHDELMDMCTNFTIADNEMDPICLLNKDWDDIKLDLMDIVGK